MFLTGDVGLAQDLQGQSPVLRATECALVFPLQALGARLLTQELPEDEDSPGRWALASPP